MQKGELHMGKQDEFLWDETPMGEKVGGSGRISTQAKFTIYVD